MAEPLALSPDAAPTPTSPVPAGGLSTDLVALTKEQLSEMLRSAVAAGAAQHQASLALGAPAVVAETPEEWSQRDLMHALVSHARWFNERDHRSAVHSVNTLWPAEGDE